MKGYIINTTDKWQHICKRAIMPGGKLPLAELFEEYNMGEEFFIDWLKKYKLREGLEITEEDN